MADQPRLYNLMAHADERRERLRQHAVDGLRNVFPIVDAGYILDVEDYDVSKERFSPGEQKDAILRGKTLVEPLKGSLVLKDEKTGKVLDRSKRTLLHLPYFTERHTFVMGGNDYSISNQVRIKPGVYTRRRENGQLESSFNLGKGRNFRLSMDPERGIIFQEYGSTKIPLVVTLRLLGVNNSAISRAWGKDLYDLNNQYAAGKESSYRDKLYNKIVAPWKRDVSSSPDEKRQAIIDALEDTQLDPSVTELTLGAGFSKVEPQALLRASKKLLDVYQGKERQDDRDSLAFKTMHTAETFVKERIEKDAGRDVNRKVKTKLRRMGYKTPKIKNILPSAPFTKSVHKFFTQSALSATPMQINPMEIVDSSVKVTSLGEGGISSTLAVPDEARDVHGSHLGILDPVRTPESGKAGVDVRATIHMARDDDGNMYAPLVNKKTGKAEYVRADELLKKRVAFPNQKLTGRKKVDVLHLGVVRSVSPSEVDYVVPTPHSMYSPTTNLVPFLESAQGNRNVMGAKMQTQALPLLHREAPLVQVGAWKGARTDTVEGELGRLIVPTSPVDGTIEKIEGDFVFIRPDRTKKSGEKTAADDLRKIPVANMFPMMSKTYVHDELSVKAGDKVKKGDPLGDNNFTRDGKLALGRNLSVAYMPYYGYNSNDAVVISEGASQKMTSTHMYKEVLDLDASITLGTDKHKAYYGSKYNASQYAKLDARGVVRKGAKVDHGDLLIAALRQATPTSRASMLGKLHKSLVKPYVDAALTWTHESPGEIVDVVMTGDRVALTIKTAEPMRVGDKLCFDAETEVLTSTGWKPVARVTLDDEVCTLVDGEIVYQEPTATHAYPEGGAMYRLESQQLDMLVTMKHRLYIQRRGQEDFELLPAADVRGKRVRSKRMGVGPPCRRRILPCPRCASLRGKGALALD